MFVAVVTLTIGGFLLFTGLFFRLSYTPPCSSYFEGVVCGPAPLYVGIIARVASAMLFAVGLFRAAVVPGARNIAKLGESPPKMLCRHEGIEGSAWSRGRALRRGGRSVRSSDPSRPNDETGADCSSFLLEATLLCGQV